jgi:hypothetical protein
MLDAFDYSYWRTPLDTYIYYFMSLNSRYLNFYIDSRKHGLAQLLASLMALVIIALAPLQVKADTDIYMAEIEVVDDVSESDAINAAFVQVITALTGSTNSRNNALIKQGLLSAEEFVSHLASTQREDEQPVLQVRFDQVAVDQLLTQAGLPIWGAERANLLAWLVIERQGMQELIGDDDDEAAVLLRQHTELRGIPLVLPLMDLTDQSQVSISDIGGRFWQPIVEASQRYQAQGIVIGRVYQTIDGYWHGQGQLKLPDGTETWQLQAAELKVMLARLSEELGGMLVQRYALQTDSNSSSQLFVQVQRVGELQAYADLLKVLAEVSSVTDVKVVSLHGDTVLLRVTHQGEAKKLLLGLELESRLALLDGQQANAYSASQSAHTAYYVWQ